MDWIENDPPKPSRPYDGTVFYLDTSAITKLYVKEPGSRELSRWFGDPKKGFHPDVELFTSRLGLPETVSAINRKGNTGAVPKESLSPLWHSVLTDFAAPSPPYTLIDVSISVIGRAAWLVAHHGLRAYDAVHLASALWLQPRFGDGASLVFVTADRKLMAAAQAEQLATADPTPPKAGPSSAN